MDLAYLDYLATSGNSFFHRSSPGLKLHEPRLLIRGHPGLADVLRKSVLLLCRFVLALVGIDHPIGGESL